MNTYLDDASAWNKANAYQPKQHIDDDIAIQKANSLIPERQIIRFNKSPAARPVKNFNDMDFDELSEVYASERIKLKEFFSLPEEMRKELNVMLEKHYKRMTAARIHMMRAANPEQTLLIADYEEMKVNLAKRPAGESSHTDKHVNHIKRMNADLLEKNKKLEAKIKELNVRLHDGKSEGVE